MKHTVQSDLFLVEIQNGFGSFDEKAQFFKIPCGKRLFAWLGVQEAKRSAYFSTDSNG